MTRDEFEATVWRVLSHYSRCPLVHHADEIITAAENLAHTTAAAALETNGRTRRPAAVHYLSGSGQPSCGYGRGMADPGLTSDPGQVTCGACRRTAGHRQALALAMAS